MHPEWNIHDKLALENTEQAGSITCAQELIEIPFIVCAVLQRNKKWEREEQKEEYKDFWLQRQEKPYTTYWNIITKNYTMSQKTRWTFNDFIYKCYCLPRRSAWYIRHTEAC